MKKQQHQQKIHYENGFFGLGEQYQDTCSQNNCMALLTEQVIIFLLVKPLIEFCYNVGLPLVCLIISDKFKIETFLSFL
jgi:hypothetical protein